MDGDKSGKGTHLCDLSSQFLHCIHESIKWPLRQTVTLNCILGGGTSFNNDPLINYKPDPSSF